MSFSFIRLFFANPRSVGAIAPSSARLSTAMASCVKGFDSVLELGGGTGAITRELLKLKLAQLEVVEINKKLALALENTWPTLAVHQICASEALDAFVPRGRPVVISSLPFKSLPSEVSQRTVQSALAFLRRHEAAQWVQFTYGASPPFKVPPEYRWERKAWILGNLPPAGLWVLLKNPAQPAPDKV